MEANASEQRQLRVIRTPDQRLRVFVSSTLQEMGEERAAAQGAIEVLRLSPVLFEQGARPHPAQDLYRAYLAQSHIFIGLYWQRYGWVAPDMEISGLEDEYRLASALPKLIYIKTPAPDREPGLANLLRAIKNDSGVSYKYFSTNDELRDLIANDLALLLTERFEQGQVTLTAVASGAQGVAKIAPRPRLPLLPAPLIGREEQAEALRALLLDGRTRLVTLVGPGGVGKTSLALQVAAETAGEFADGAYWAPLATIHDAELVLSTVAQALDVRERAGTPLAESVKEFLQERKALLLLDNFEQVLQAAPVVGELLSAAAGLKILVTSRAPLQIRAERELALPPLALPESGGALSPEQARQNPAVALFVERAQAVDASFELNLANVQAVSEIVRRLDGLPLAIELAAARSKLLSVQSILERMDSRLKLLTGGPRDLPQRQQTLRNAIGWSYDLLDEDSQKLFRRLGAFAGDFTLDASEAVCNPRDELDVLGGVQTLLDYSLLRREPRETQLEHYVMLHTIREYALERLAQAGEAEQTLQRHGHAFASLAEAAWPRMFSGASEEWLDRLALAYGNLRSALDWLHRREDADTVRKLIVHLVWFWYRRGYLNEARLWYTQALQQVAQSPPGALDGLLMGHAGAVAMWQSDLPAAARLMDDSIAILRQFGETVALGDVLFTRGVLAVNQGQDAGATAVLEEALALMERLEQDWFVAMITLHLGNVALNQGEVDAASTRMEEALVTGRRVGDRWIMASAINNLGEIARYRQDFDGAERHYQESMALFRSVGSTPDVARADHSLGYVAIWRGDYGRALELFERSLSLYRQVGVKRGVVECLNGLAALAAAVGQCDVSARLAATARAEFAALGAGIWPADRLDVRRIMTASGAQADLDGTEVMALGEALAMARTLLADTVGDKV